MNTLSNILKKIALYLNYPFMITCSLLLLTNFIGLFKIEEFEIINDYFNENVNLIFCIVAPAFVTFYICENIKKSIVSSVSVLICDLTLYSLCEIHLSFVGVVILSIVCSFVCKNFEIVYCYFILLIGSITISLIIGICYEFLYNGLREFANLIKGKGTLFGVINNFYSIFIGNNFEDLFYHKGYSETGLINDKLVSGAIDIFNADVQNPSSVISKYLTGKYILNFFVTIGSFAFLYSRVNKNEKFSLIIISLLAVLFGDVRFISLFILIYNPALYLCYLFLIFICYVVPNFLDIRIGFINNGSIFEFFKYSNNIFIFLLVGIVIVFLTFYSFKLVETRFNFQQQKFYPKKVKKIISSLGGEDNIQRISKDKVLVFNPNLIDIIRLDCDIHENEITLNYDDLQLLKEFF
jgi:hypothetical protein